MIAIGADHGGFEIKEAVRRYLEEKGIAYKDFGVFDKNPADYPIIAQKVALLVADGTAQQGILCCGTGLGISIAANKVNGARAAVASDAFSAEMARRHNDANILCMGGRIINGEKAAELTAIFLHTSFDGGRHAKRVEMLTAIENGSTL